jgi:hypothetical protein
MPPGVGTRQIGRAPGVLRPQTLGLGWSVEQVRSVALPDALERKYPHAPREWAWQRGSFSTAPTR